MDLLTGGRPNRRGWRKGVAPLPVPDMARLPAAWHPVIAAAGGHPKGATMDRANRAATQDVLERRMVCQLAYLAPRVDPAFADPAALPSDTAGMRALYAGLVHAAAQELCIANPSREQTVQLTRKVYAMARVFRRLRPSQAATFRTHGAATIGLRALPDLPARLLAAGVPETNIARASHAQMVRALAPKLAEQLETYTDAIASGGIQHAVKKADKHEKAQWDMAQRWVGRLLRGGYDTTTLTLSDLFAQRVPTPAGLTLPGKSMVPLAQALLFADAKRGVPARSRYVPHNAGGRTVFIPSHWSDDVWQAWTVCSRLSFGSDGAHKFAAMLLAGDKLSATDRPMLEGFDLVKTWMENLPGVSQGTQQTRKQGLDQISMTWADLVCVGLPKQRIRLDAKLHRKADIYSAKWWAQFKALTHHLAWEVSLAGALRGANYTHGLLGHNFLPQLDGAGHIVGLSEAWWGVDAYSYASLKKATVKDKKGPESKTPRQIAARPLMRGVVSMHLLQRYFGEFYPHVLVHLGYLRNAEDFSLRRLTALPWTFGDRDSVQLPALFLSRSAGKTKRPLWRGQFSAWTMVEEMGRNLHECLVLCGEILPNYEDAKVAMPYVFATHTRRHFLALTLGTLMGEYDQAARALNSSTTVVMTSYANAQGKLADRLRQFGDQYDPRNPRHFLDVVRRLRADRDTDAPHWADFWARFSPQDPRRALDYLDRAGMQPA